MGTLFATLFLVACGGPEGPTPSEVLRTERIVPVDPAPYYDVAWLGLDVIALARPQPGRGSQIVLIDLQGKQMDEVPWSKRDGCDGQIFSAMSRLASGELGFAEVCENDAAALKRSTLLAYDQTTRVVRELGHISQPPKEAAWSVDMSRAMYSAEGGLCSTIYDVQIDAEALIDNPSSVVVSAQGQSFALGEDLDATPDHCTSVALSDYPVLGFDGDAAAFVSYVGDKKGQDRIALPWAIVEIRQSGSTSPIDGVLHPRGLGIISEEVYAFAGQVDGKTGLWTVGSDGSGFLRIGELTLASFSISPNGRSLVAILHGELTPTPEAEDHKVAVYDLGDLYRD